MTTAAHDDRAHPSPGQHTRLQASRAVDAGYVPSTQQADRAARSAVNAQGEIAMAEAGRVSARDQFGHSSQRGCPAWCYECEHDCGPEGAFWHHGPPHETILYGESSELLSATVRATFFDKLPADFGTDPADLERPFVRFEVPDDGVDLSLTPAQARQLAAALLRAADTAETGQPEPSPV